MAQSRELVKGNIESLLLSLIGQQSMYGYQIIKELEKKSQGYFKFKEGTLYPILHRLERAGLLTSKWQMLSGERQRKYYYISEKGRYNLVAKTIEWQDFFIAMNRVMQSVRP